MAKLKLSRPQEEIIDLLAHIAAVSEIEGHFPELKGLLDTYKSKLTPKQLAIWKHFQSHCVKVRHNLVKEMEKELDNA